MSNTNKIAPVNWHFNCQLTRIYENFIEQYFRSIKSISKKIKKSDSYDKNHMKEKVNELVRLHEAMQGKLKTASYSEQIPILTWYLNVLFRIL